MKTEWVARNAANVDELLTSSSTSVDELLTALERQTRKKQLSLTTDQISRLGMCMDDSTRTLWNKNLTAYCYDALDVDRDGKITKEEFERYISMRRGVRADKHHAGKPEHFVEHTEDTTDTAVTSITAELPTRRQLSRTMLTAMVPFIGFGIVDNAVMIIAGEYIDMKLGIMFGLSSMAAAGLGNTFSDIVGISVGNHIEAFVDKLGFARANLSLEQYKLKVVRRVIMFGNMFGITIGCLIGMFPLLFIDAEKDQQIHLQKVLNSTKFDSLCDAAFDLADTDRSGRVSSKELADFEEHLAELQQHFNVKVVKLRKQQREVLLAAHTKDAQLTKAEFKELCKAYVQTYYLKT